MLRPSVRALSRRFTPSYERRVMILLLCVLAIDYADRGLIGALGPTLKSVFHIGNTQLGILAAAFAFVGAGASVPMGIFVDRTRRMLLLGLSLIVWAGAMVLTGVAISFVMLFVARLLLGSVAATTGPAVPSLTGDLVPAGERGKALGFIESGQLLGAGAGLILAASITAFLSFRWCFWLLAGAGVVLAVAFFRIHEPPRTGAAGPSSDHRARQRPSNPQAPEGRVQQMVQAAGVQPSRGAILRRDPDQLSIWEAARYVLRVRTDVIVLVSRSIGDYFFAGVGTFAVVFATKQYGISQREADLATLVLGAGALAGVLLSGRFSDTLLRRGKLNARVWLGVIGYLAAPLPLLPAVLTRSLLVALPLLTLSAFCIAGAGTPLDAVRIDVLVPLMRGRAEAIRQVLRTAAEGAAPLLFGLLSAHLAGGGRAGLQLAFVVALPTLLVAGLILLLALRSYQADVAATLASTEGSSLDLSRRS